MSDSNPQLQDTMSVSINNPSNDEKEAALNFYNARKKHRTLTAMWLTSLALMFLKLLLPLGFVTQTIMVFVLLALAVWLGTNREKARKEVERRREAMLTLQTSKLRKALKSIYMET